MITLITGLPGACKTLYTLTFVKAWAEKEGRDVFYAGIKDLMLPWTEIDATKWFECPTGSIIVIDEAQTIFRPRSLGKEPPDYVSKLETHRHQGIDIVLITQHPLLVDSAIRRLTGKHMHCVRQWGMQKSTLHEWNSVRENCDKPAGRTDSIKHHWKFDKRSYAFYKSAEVHTVKRNIPMRVWVLFVGMPLIFAFLGYRIYSSVNERMHPTAAAQSSGAIKSAAPAGLRDDTPKPAYLDPVDDARRFVFDRTPRVDGLQLTAPRYDKVTEAKTAPIPAACVTMQGQCKCYSQQGTRLDVPADMCIEIVERGFFVDFDDGRQQQAQQSQWGQPYYVRGDSLRVAADPQSADPAREARTAALMLAADDVRAGRAPEGVQVPEQFAKGMLH